MVLRLRAYDGFSPYPVQAWPPGDAPRTEQPVNYRLEVTNPLVLGDQSTLLSNLVDRVRPALRRSEPSSRTTLMDEQSNPWDLLQPQDVMSRHRGRELLCRYGLSRETTLLSLAYL